MKPAIISITVKRRLNSNYKKKFDFGDNDDYKYIYETCLERYLNSIGMYKEHIKDAYHFKYFSRNIQENMQAIPTELVRSLLNNQNKKIPDFTDESGVMTFTASNVTSNIVDSDISGRFELDLLFEIQPLTLVGVVWDKLIVAQGDKTDDIIEKKELQVFSLLLNSNMWINSYKEI